MRKILIVDDQPQVRELVEVTLRVGDYLIFQANDGCGALEIAKTEKPDLILLDVMMPAGGRDGFEVCEIIKDDPATKDIIVIMLTAKGQEADRIRGKEAGADGYLTKPFSPLELLKEVETLLGD